MFAILKPISRPVVSHNYYSFFGNSSKNFTNLAVNRVKLYVACQIFGLLQSTYLLLQCLRYVPPCSSLSVTWFLVLLRYTEKPFQIYRRNFNSHESKIIIISVTAYFTYHSIFQVNLYFRRQQDILLLLLIVFNFILISAFPFICLWVPGLFLMYYK